MNKRSTKKAKAIVLIAEDDPMQQLLITQALSTEPYELIVATHGAEAIEKFILHQPDLVLLDVYMPIKNGFEVCEAIRATPEGKYTAILMSTSLDDDASINKAFEVGATDFIVKPLNWTILKYRIRYTMRSVNNLYDLHYSQEKNKAILNALPDSMYCFDQRGICIDFKDRKDSKDSKDFFIGKHITEMYPSQVSRLFLEKLSELNSNNQSVSFEYMLSNVETSNFYEARLVYNDDHVLAIVRDITDKKKTNEKLMQMAYYDKLTSLPNSLYFKEQLHIKLNAEGFNNKQYSILFIDLDRFKHINDCFGHSVGDQLLKLAVDRFHQCFKQALYLRDEGKSKLELFARFGGDEFILLLKDNHPETTTTLLAQQIIEFFGAPFSLEQQDIYITPSIGISVYPRDGKDVDTIVKNADVAMYHSKSNGRNTFHFYNAEMNKASHAIIELETRMRKALDKHHFVIYYQPQIDIFKNEIVGAEALIRWKDPETGLIPPSQFIPIAEETGIIEELSAWIFEHACIQMKQWLLHGIHLKSIGINLSAKQFRNEKLVQNIERMLSKIELPPHFIDLELTESMIMSYDQSPTQILQSLKSLGLKLSIDDFGTGYSSLSYLREFPIDYLKVDRSFVINLTQNSIDRKIVNAIISMAHALQLKVIAEGVEDKSQLDILSELECDIIQGYYFAKPMPANEFEDFYENFERERALPKRNSAKD